MSDILSGKTVAVTASRRAEEQAGAFERAGAQVLVAPTVRIVKTEDDAALLDETRQVIASPPDMLLVATGYGLKSWFEAVEKAGLKEELSRALEQTAFYVRGAKGRGAVRGLGYKDSGIAEIETTESLVELALAVGVQGKTVVLQQHGQPDPALTRRLEGAGAVVIQVHPNRWAQPAEPEKAERLIDAVLAGEIDIITFTAAPAFEAMLHRAAQRNQRQALVEALKRITVAAVGPVTAEPMEKLDIAPIVPERSRMGAMIKAVLARFEGER